MGDGNAADDRRADGGRYHTRVLAHQRRPPHGPREGNGAEGSRRGRAAEGGHRLAHPVAAGWKLFHLPAVGQRIRACGQRPAGHPAERDDLRVLDGPAGRRAVRQPHAREGVPGRQPLPPDGDHLLPQRHPLDRRQTGACGAQGSCGQPLDQDAHHLRRQRQLQPTADPRRRGQGRAHPRGEPGRRLGHHADRHLRPGRFLLADTGHRCQRPHDPDGLRLDLEALPGDGDQRQGASNELRLRYGAWLADVGQRTQWRRDGLELRVRRLRAHAQGDPARR